VPQHGNQASTNSLPMEEKQMEGLPQPLQEEKVFDALTKQWTKKKRGYFPYQIEGDNEEIICPMQNK